MCLPIILVDSARLSHTHDQKYHCIIVCPRIFWRSASKLSTIVPATAPLVVWQNSGKYFSCQSGVASGSYEMRETLAAFRFSTQNFPSANALRCFCELIATWAACNICWFQFYVNLIYHNRHNITGNKIHIIESVSSEISKIVSRTQCLRNKRKDERRNEQFIIYLQKVLAILKYLEFVSQLLSELVIFFAALNVLQLHPMLGSASCKFLGHNHKFKPTKLTHSWFMWK